MRRLLFSFAAVCLLAGCADSLDHDNGRWLVTHQDGETDYEMGDRVLFQNDSADISAHAYDVITDVANDARRQARATIIVEGFTDTSGSHEHNIALSQARANHVADILVQHGIARRRITAHGYGETRLAVQTLNGVSETRNRRVIVRIVAAR